MATDEVIPQENPDPGHDCSEHSYTPNANGVCIICGWWDPNGDVCPKCGKKWSEHNIFGVLVIRMKEAHPEARWN